MELIRGTQNITPQHHGCVLTIGKFDGVHLGHQMILKQVIEQARKLRLPATVMVFEPQPEEVFTPEKAPARLSLLRDKYAQLQKLGIDRLLCVRFDHKFAAQSPEFFIDDLLVQQLGVKFLVVGDDFRFGRSRLGDFAMLQSAGKRLDFEVVNTDSFCLEKERISSSAIRDALAKGEMSLAQTMLGRTYTLAGNVVHGDKKGRTIDFPTANIPLPQLKVPVSGVFVVSAQHQGRILKGVANVGTRPTVNGQRCQLEVHLFDFSGDIYGQRLQVALHHRLRGERKFPDFAALKQQIEQDAQAARQWWQDQPATLS